jgi:hypothetical protein
MSDSRRCPICEGIHPKFPCPLEESRKPVREITDEEAAATDRFLERYTRQKTIRDE